MSKDKSYNNILDVVGVNTGNIKDDDGFDLFKTFEYCPYKTCDGSGLVVLKNGTSATECKCLIDKKMKQRALNANINPKYLEKGFDFDDGGTMSEIFVPREKPTPFEKSPRIKNIREENVNNFIKRNYLVKKQKRDLKELLTSYCDTNIKLLNDGDQGVNLLLFGEPANGKTSFSIAMALYFLENGKTAYFSTSQNLLDNIFEKDSDVMKNAENVEVLVLDELFNEYHSGTTDFAQKKLLELLKHREELGLVTISTSNGNPKDFYLLYGESFMSLLNGTFFMFRLIRESDGRVEKMQDNLKKFNF